MLTGELAGAFARIALTNVGTEYPYKLDQVLDSEADVRAPRALHPAFHGSYDWHSSVHMHWSLARVLRRYPQQPDAAAIHDHFNRRLTRDTIAGELQTLAGPNRASFERPYGWGWLLKLAAELEHLAVADPRAKRWRDALAPLAHAMADRFIAFLPRATYPTRAGAHGNSAFALLLALDYCEASQHPALHNAVVESANRWFGHDRRYPAHYEPSGDDFLSGGLVQAALMRRVVDSCSFADWWQQFRPARDALSTWLQPAVVSDAHDPKTVHLHGLNLSRAWCWRQLLPELDDELAGIVKSAIDRHLATSLPAASAGDYVGTHWLASFALLALLEK